MPFEHRRSFIKLEFSATIPIELWHSVCVKRPSGEVKSVLCCVCAFVGESLRSCAQ